MKNPTPLIILAPLSLLTMLGACNSQPEVIDPNAHDDQKVAAAPVQLPPMMTASRTYRCKDNSLVYIDFFNDNTAMYKTENTPTGGTQLKSEGEGKAFTADGYSVSGNTDTISLTAPGKGSTSCKA